MESIDVLIPFYNDRDGFRKTIASIKAQTCLPQLRLVVVDDGSTAEHAHTLSRLLMQFDVPYRLITNAHNRGRPYTRNLLLDNIQSDYVAWLDSGDEWFPEKIARQLAALNKAGVTKDSDDCWATCSYEWREEGKAPQQITQQTEGDVIKSLLVGKKLRAYLWTILAPAPAMRRVEFFDKSLPRLQDLDFFLRFAISGGRLVQPDDETSLCAYNKDHADRCAREIDNAYSHIFEKHDAVYRNYGRKFRAECQRRAKKNSARFAEANGQIELGKSLQWQRHAIALRYLVGLS